LETVGITWEEVEDATTDLRDGDKLMCRVPRQELSLSIDRAYVDAVGKVQSGKQVNKKHFQNNSNETDL